MKPRTAKTARVKDTLFYPACLTINRLRLSVHLGCYEDEREKPQPVEVDIRFYFPALPPSCTDDSDRDFICYDKVHNLLIEKTAQQDYRLIEFLAHEIHALVRKHILAPLKARGRGIKVWVRLNKPMAPVPYMLGGASFVFSNLPPGAKTVDV